MVLALKALGETAIGIHENFEESDDFTATVPKRDAPGGARYWVHQNKLIEGIDDPNFKVVALFNSLRNGRAIVQQIGRRFFAFDPRRAGYKPLCTHNRLGRGFRSLRVQFAKR